MKRILPITFLFLAFFSAQAQTTYKKNTYSIKRSHIVDPAKAQPDYNAIIKHREAPSPQGEDYKAFLMRQKIKSRELYPIQKAEKSNSKKKTTTAQPNVGDGLSMFNVLLNGAVIDYSGGIPNDNAMAISNDGILLAGVNSVIWAYDTKGDSTIFPKNILSLAFAGNGGNGNNYFDPKLIYDEGADRFILIFLRNNVPATSAFIVCFSSSNNPLDPWYVYEIDGNPLDNNRWTDFPALSITDDELFITGNLIIPGVSWQVGFDRSVLWQINKEDGYSNADSLRNVLFSEMKFDGKFTRNLHPVRGTGSTAKRQFFMSNRNFDVTNDTVFVMEVVGTLDNSTLNIGMGKTSPNYGVPPNGRQQDTDLSDPTKGLQTNDGRVLGAITNGEWIQFVSTTMNPATGFASIYHGTIENPLTPNQTISGVLISDSVRDYGYPNIAFSGNEDCDIETIIGFNYTSPNDFPGVAAVYYDNDGNYSDVVTLKEGDNYTDRHSDSYERWGDYFGIQPKFNEPGKIWTAGYFGLSNNRNGTWFNELSSPDSSVFTVQSSESGQAVYCEGSFMLNASGGLPPYEYSFNNKALSEDNFMDSLCDGDTIIYSVTDQRGCMITDTIKLAKIAGGSTGTYPNPFSSQIVAQFEMSKDASVSVYIYNLSGQLVDEVISSTAKSGLNELQFDLSPLKAGMYVLKIVTGDDDEVLVNKIFKRE